MNVFTGIYSFDNFLNDDECKQYIELISEKIKKGGLVCFSDTSGATNDKYIDLDLSTFFYERLKEKTIDIVTDTEKLTTLTNDIICPNNLIMWSKYVDGEMFGLHTDTGLYYNVEKNLKTRYTLLIYLNDDFEGGETTFYDNNFKETIKVCPKKGSCVVFDIDLWHKGCTIKNGEKYWIGCELIGKMNNK